MESTEAPEIYYKEDVAGILLSLLEIAGIENRGSTDFEREYQKYLKFQQEIDWKRYRASLDLLVDTDYAIQEVFKYQLGKKEGSTKAEHYLRLYGVLNAVYLQMSAYKTIAMLLNYPLRNNVERDFKELAIYQLRNLAAAHTLDYEYDDAVKSRTFRLMQADLSYSGNRITMISENGEQFDYNLLRVLSEYDQLATQLLINLTKHAIEKLVFKKGYRVELTARLKQRLEGLINYSTLNKND